jgi:hypothetical protein
MNARYAESGRESVTKAAIDILDGEGGENIDDSLGSAWPSSSAMIYNVSGPSTAHALGIR